MNREINQDVNQEINSNTSPNASLDLGLWRSVLYVAGDKPRALAKAKGLPADALILDLEDAVSGENKKQARVEIALALEGGFADQTVAVRINAASTPWHIQDLEWLAGLSETASSSLAAIVLPKVERVEQLESKTYSIKPIWATLETPLGILQAAQIAAHSQVQALVLGTSDLVADLRARHMPTRENLFFALSNVVCAARAYGKIALDGVYLDYLDQVGLEAACIQARDFGFDGKTLIHPSQLEGANRVFSPSPSELEWAQKVLDVWEQAREQGLSVATLQGKLIEELHVREARRLLEGVLKRKNVRT